MLGAVLPEMRMQAEALAADLADLLRVRKEIADETRPAGRAISPRSTASAQRMTVLIEERQKKQAETEKALEAERQRAAELARQADNLKDLIGKLEQGLDQRDPGRARGAPAAKATPGDLAALKDPGRLAPAVALPPPAGKFRFRLTASNSGNSGLPTASAAPKRAFPSPPAPAPRSPPRATAGWFMPGPSAITANS